jgi:hypothetical protein
MTEKFSQSRSLPYEAFERPGIYRRRIRIQTGPGEARADLEDDPHRYGVVIRHDGERVTAIGGLTLRTPWTLCREAARVLDRLLGMPLSSNPLAVYRYADGRVQCTHLFDIAGLAIAHAARGTLLRQYDIDVPCFNPMGARTARLRRDGHELLWWTVEDTRITAPTHFAGRNLRNMMPWVEERFADVDDFEAIVVLRRAVNISGSRAYDLDAMPHAQATGHVTGACYVFQPGVAERAVRVFGSTLDFGESPEHLLADLEGKP